MLKAVVEQDELRFQFFDGDFRGRHAVGILHVRHVGQLLLQLPGFVVAARRLPPRSRG